MAAYGAFTTGDQLAEGRWAFIVMPEVHAASGDATPIYGRTDTDGKTVGAWNVIHDGVAGDLFHFTTGPNTLSNPNGSVIAIGVDNGATGIVVQNKKQGVGLTLNQLNTITSASAYMLNCDHFSSVAVFSSWRVNSTATKAMMAFKASSAPASAPWMTFADNVGPSGQINADTGMIVWTRDIEITDTTKGFILKSPDGTRYRLKVANGGALSTEAA